MVLLHLLSICITFEGIITFVASNSIFKKFDCTHKFSAVLLCQKVNGGNKVYFKIHLVFTTSRDMRSFFSFALFFYFN